MPNLARLRYFDDVQVGALRLLLNCLLLLPSKSLHPTKHALHNDVLWCRPYRIIPEMRLCFLILKNNYNVG